MTRGERSRVADINEVRSRFEQWRRTRQGKARIPDELWSAAIELARRDGVYRTASALHLDGGKLKRRMGASEARSRRTTPPAFVELLASGGVPTGVPSGPSLPAYTIELEGSRGKLRIHCPGATAADLAELSRVLWGLAA